MAKGCWAELLGDCEGPLTGEHLVSDCLFKKQVSVRGMRWCVSEFKTVGIASLVSHCLCRSHNNRLSPCDSEAKRWLEVMDWMLRDSALPGDGPELVKTIDGFLLAKWAAKTACSIAASSGDPVHKALIRYAFSTLDDPRIGFYLFAGKGTRFEASTEHLGVYWIHASNMPEQVVVCFRLYGVPFVLATMPIEGATPLIEEALGLSIGSGNKPMDRLSRIRVGWPNGVRRTDLRGEVHFQWPKPGPQSLGSS